VGSSSIKIPAAWLIEQCQLKGQAVGGVRVYPQHALVLTNFAQGSGEDLLALVAMIQTKVKQKYDISLILEVQLIGKQAND
jgi:UDP-N-acetylmuramate dehydrogenase